MAVIYRGINRLARVLALCLALTAPAQAEPAGPRLAELAAHAPLAASERLRLRARGDAMTAGGLSRQGFRGFQRDMRLQGFDGSGTVSRSLSLAPLVTWDENINGGLLEDRLWLNGWLFRADPAMKAKAGLVAGATLAGSLRQVWSEGRALSLTAATELGWSPRHHIGRGDLMLRGCALNQLQGWSFLDFCATGQRSFRQRATQNHLDLSLSLHQILKGTQGYHDASLRLSSARPEGEAPQTRVTLGAESLWSFGVTDIALTLGERQAGETRLRHRVSAGVTVLARGRPLSFDLAQEVSSGGSFAGIERHDRVTSVRLSAPLTESLSARLGLVRSRSTVSIASYDRVSFELRFSDWLSR
ncbi:hypothetical protein [Falsigemmobacter faecalis]|uniref:DUF560 domain-containing protein n=1 Tax=Falsigemmobacter faecalis TaxID=2488730 RepID=A0A3P3DVC2_9RHOB|nr:hypothetical protein [Falsigemmobacter faecalis]RRH78223.1 hypothetical protein EG244_01910 [Falsigemmobacter faecalis]